MTTPPRWYWVVATLALLWMLLGVAAWLIDLFTDETTLEELSEAQRQLYAARPAWLFIVYGIAIFSGLLGALALLLRRVWAVPALATSLVALIVHLSYTFLGLDAIRLLGPAAALPFPLLIFAIGVALLGLARHARTHGWLRS